MTKKACASFEIINSRGLHARPASMFVQESSRFSASVTVENETSGDSADGKSLMSMLMLAASCGTKLKITAEGSDADEALGVLGSLISKGFDEE